MLLTLLAAGCTMSFTYNHLDWLIPWYVDDYVDLSRQQRQVLQSQLGPVLQWHREEELEHYLEWNAQIAGGLHEGPAAARTTRSIAPNVYCSPCRSARGSLGGRWRRRHSQAWSAP